jgi:hypothetical protein
VYAQILVLLVAVVATRVRPLLADRLQNLSGLTGRGAQP